MSRGSFIKTRNEFLNSHWQPYPAMPPTVEVAGRILSLNSKSISLNIGQKGEVFLFDTKVFLLPQKETVQEFDLESVLKFGDVIGLELVSGKVRNIWLLAPQMEKLEKSINRDRLEAWSTFLLQTKLFFIERGFLEVNTPTLVSCPGTEPYLDVFSTNFKMGKLLKKFYLPTSPELHLKKMLLMDYGPLFEIKNCFRNGEISEHHQPEFFMLEWYRPYASLNEILLDLEDLITELLPDGEISLTQITMPDLFQNILDFKLQPQTSQNELYELAIKHKLKVQNTDSIEDLFGLIFVDLIEPKLVTDSPLIVSKYPPFQAAYARLTEDGWADRFELYWKGLEIANAFHEVNDPILQEARMREDLEKKTKIGKETFEIDQEFLQALKSGLPPTGGIALGLERLFMALNGITKIQDLKPFIFHP